MQRKPLSRWAQQMHVQVLSDERGGGAEYDHWYSRLRKQAEEIWLICQSCNAQLSRSTELKAGARSAFESYQVTLRRVLQAQQARQSPLMESAAS